VQGLGGMTDAAVSRGDLGTGLRSETRRSPIATGTPPCRTPASRSRRARSRRLSA
jgi:hypothetical protein